MTNEQFLMSVPEMTVEEYAKRTGLTYRTVDNWVSRGYLPARKLGKYRLINIALITRDCLDREA